MSMHGSCKPSREVCVCVCVCVCVVAWLSLLEGLLRGILLLLGASSNICAPNYVYSPRSTSNFYMGRPKGNERQTAFYLGSQPKIVNYSQLLRFVMCKVFYFVPCSNTASISTGWELHFRLEWFDKVSLHFLNLLQHYLLDFSLWTLWTGPHTP